MSCYSEPLTPEARPPSAGDMHVLDQAIRQIAVDFRFTLEEVQGYYDRCGEMGQTRARFQNMRALLADRFPDDI
jgi:hypothetical protein